MMRHANTLLLIAMLVLLPALCLGGLLEHECDCGSELTCSHEVSCPDDPCSSLTRPGERTDVGCDESVPSAAPGSIAPVEASGLRSGLRSSATGLIDRTVLPYRESDRPLRL